jgi:Transposase DNA-binding
MDRDVELRTWGRREVPEAEISSWLEREVAGCRFEDRRHGKRFRTLLEQLSERIGSSIPFACQDLKNTELP